MNVEGNRTLIIRLTVSSVQGRGALGLYNSSGDKGKLLFTATGQTIASRRENKQPGLRGWGVVNVPHFTILLVIVSLDNVVQVGLLLFVAFLMLSNELPVVVATLATTLVLIGGVFGKARCGYLAEQIGNKTRVRPCSITDSCRTHWHRRGSRVVSTDTAYAIRCSLTGLYLHNLQLRGPDLPTPGAAGGAALVDNKVHWFGGIDAAANCDVGRHLVHDLRSPASGWKDITAKAGMPSPRNHFSTAVVDGIIYAMGGQYGHDNCPGKNTQDTPLVHAFDPNNNSWSRKADMPNKNSHSEPGTFVYKGDIYTVGGENTKDKVWQYNPRTDSWKHLQDA